LFLNETSIIVMSSYFKILLPHFLCCWRIDIARMYKCKYVTKATYEYFYTKFIYTDQIQIGYLCRFFPRLNQLAASAIYSYIWQTFYLPSRITWTWIGNEHPAIFRDCRVDFSVPISNRFDRILCFRESGDI